MSKSVSTVGFDDDKNLPAVIELDAAWGHEAVTADQLITPRLDIAQPTGRALKPSLPQYIDAARQGDIYNSITREVYKDVELLYAHHEHLYTLWTLFDEGGGFHGTRPIDDPEMLEEVKRQGGQFPSERERVSGHRELMVPSLGDNVHAVEQYTLYAVYGHPNLTEEDASPVTLTAKGVSITPFRNFISAMNGMRYRGQRVPFGALRWRLTTELDSRASGDSYKWAFRLADGATVNNPTPALIGRHDPRYVAGKQFHDLIAAGRVAAPDYAADAPSDDEVPF